MTQVVDELHSLPVSTKLKYIAGRNASASCCLLHAAALQPWQSATGVICDAVAVGAFVID
jgi:hypothetical protein